MPLSRRELITAAGAAWLGLRATPAGAMPPPDPPLALRRGIDLTPNGIIRPGSPQDYRVLRAQPWAAPLIARMTHLRMWADWPTLQPRPDALDEAALATLDAQVDAAVADGLLVILMPYRYPRWANATENGKPDGSHGKAAAYRVPPAGHGPGSPWAGFVDALWERYAGRMAAFEVVNEPNLQLWPQGSAAETVAEMMLTVDAAARRHELAATCLAPSHSDAETRRPFMVTEHEAFTDALLAALDARGFEGGDPLGLVVPQLQRRRARREPGQRAAVAAGRSLARARWRPTAARSSMRRRAAAGSRRCAGASGRGSARRPSGRRRRTCCAPPSSASTPSAAWG